LLNDTPIDQHDAKVSLIAKIQVIDDILSVNDLKINEYFNIEEEI